MMDPGCGHVERLALDRIPSTFLPPRAAWLSVEIRRFRSFFLHHCCRPGEDVQGALDGGHLLPDDRFLRSPRRSRSVSVPSRSSVPGVPQDLSVPDKSKRRCSSNEDTRQVFATGRGSREKSVEARHTVAEVRSRAFRDDSPANARSNIRRDVFWHLESKQDTYFH